MVDPAPELPLVSLADLKGELGIALTNVANDARLLRMLRATSSRIELYCNRKFSRATTTDKVRSRGGTFLALDRVPVVSVGGVVDPDGAAVDASYFTLDDPNAGLLRNTGSGWRDTGLRVPDFSDDTRAVGTEAHAWVVTYDAGYVTGWHCDPRTSTDQANDHPMFPLAQKNIPAALEDAAIKLAVGRWRSKDRDPTIASESLSRYSASYGGAAVAGLDDVRAGAAGMPVDVVAILDSFARVIQA